MKLLEMLSKYNILSFQSFLAEAAYIRDQYIANLITIMDEFGIETEAELISWYLFYACSKVEACVEMIGPNDWIFFDYW